MLKTLMLAAVAGFLSLGASVAEGASDAEACCINVTLWANVGVESTSPVLAPSKLCMEAAGQISNQGFSFHTAKAIQPRLTALTFRRENDSATLFCAANVIEQTVVFDSDDDSDSDDDDDEDDDDDDSDDDD